MTGPRLSIRARLAITIGLLTGLIGALAVTGGLWAIGEQIRNRAIDDRLDAIGDSADGGILGSPFGTIEGFDPDELEEIFGDEMNPEELAELLEAEQSVGADLAVEAQLLLIDLAGVGLDDVLFERFADADGNLNVLLFDGSAAVISRSLTEVDVVDVADIDAIVLPFDDLQELWAVSFGAFGTDQAVAGRDLETVVGTVDGVHVGLLVDLTDELSAIDGIRGPLWAAAAALTALATAATWFLTGRALRPVAAITDRVADITSGNLDGRVPEPGGGDEVGVLARTMNRMLERLERSDRQRRQFVSDASHELRTPLAVLRSEAEVAKRAPETTTVDALGRVVLGETTRLEGLVEDLLSLARADERKLAGARTAAPIELDVDDVVLDEAERTRRLPIDRSQVSAGRVIGRADDLARAVGHLLDNAARHGDKRVAVGVRTEDRLVRIWVDDDGAGIPEEDRQRIFDRFHRLDEARTRDRGGSGLGLAVVAETAAAMGGTAEAGASPLGGARFELVLPAAGG